MVMVEQRKAEFVLIPKNHRRAKEIHQAFYVLYITNTIK